MKKIAFQIAILFAALLPLSAQAGQDDLEYFKQFMYRVDVNDSDPDFPVSTYYFLGADYFHEIPISPTQYYTIAFDFYMFEDGTYKAQYRQNLHTRGNDGFFPGPCKEFTGTWSVPDKRLVIVRDGRVLVQADRDFRHNQHAVKWTFEEAIVAPELKGQVIDGGIVQSNFPVEQSFCF